MWHILELLVCWIFFKIVFKFDKFLVPYLKYDYEHSIVGLFRHSTEKI